MKIIPHPTMEERRVYGILAYVEQHERDRIMELAPRLRDNAYTEIRAKLAKAEKKRGF